MRRRLLLRTLAQTALMVALVGASTAYRPFAPYALLGLAAGLLWLAFGTWRSTRTPLPELRAFPELRTTMMVQNRSLTVTAVFLAVLAVVIAAVAVSAF